VRKKQVIEHLKDDIPETPWEDPGITFMELRETVKRVIEQDLTTQQRKVIHHRYWDDLTEAEIAKRMRIATGTVKATTSQARAILRDNDELCEAWNTWCRPSQRTATNREDVGRHGEAPGAALTDHAGRSPAVPSAVSCDHVTDGSAPRGHSPSQKAMVDGMRIPVVEPSWGMTSVGAR
jgi:Sigma-70, region 4